MEFVKALNACAVKSHEQYLVINSALNRIAESARSEAEAHRAVEILNDHEVRNNRAPVFLVYGIKEDKFLPKNPEQ